MMQSFDVSVHENDRDLHDRAKKAALERKWSLSELIEESLRLSLWLWRPLVTGAHRPENHH